MIISKGAPRDWGGEVRDTAPQIDILKKQILKTQRHQLFYVMYPAAEISQGNRLVISILEL